MQQYRDIKSRHQDAILFFRMGEFYEMFYDDAETASRTLGLTLTARNNGGAADVPLAGVPVKAAADYVRRGIRCNAIAPGTVDTPSLAERINAFDDPVAARQMFIDRQPMGRLAKADEIAPVVVYLASDESVFATGQVFAIDGGMTI